MPRPGVGKTRRRSRRSLPGTVRVDWRRRKNSEHEITKKTNGLSYRLYALRFFPSRRFYKPEAVHLPQIRLNPRDLRLNFSVVAALRWVSRYFSRQGAKAQRGKTLQTTGFWFQTLASWRLCVKPRQGKRPIFAGFQRCVGRFRQVTRSNL